MTLTTVIFTIFTIYIFISANFLFNFLDNTFFGTFFAGIFLALFSLQLYKFQKKIDFKQSQKNELKEITSNMFVLVEKLFNIILGQYNRYDKVNTLINNFIDKLNTKYNYNYSNNVLEEINTLSSEIKKVNDLLLSKLKIIDNNISDSNRVDLDNDVKNFILISLTSHISFPNFTEIDFDKSKELFLQTKNNILKILNQIINS